MKIGVFGQGKTGREVIALLSTNHIYDSKNLPSNKDNLDALIIFIPAKAFLEHFELLLTLDCPLIIGTTGFTWSNEIQKRVLEEKRMWIHAANFSLGMFLVRKTLTQINSLISILENPRINIKETHHTDKKDAPSGTALLWNKWLDNKAEISSLRQGDVVGTHEVSIQTSTEKITISHEATDRKLFAEGAVWCAKTIVNSKQKYGLSSFESIVDRYLEDRDV